VALRRALARRGGEENPRAIAFSKEGPFEMGRQTFLLVTDRSDMTFVMALTPLELVRPASCFFAPSHGVMEGSSRCVGHRSNGVETSRIAEGVGSGWRQSGIGALEIMLVLSPPFRTRFVSVRQGNRTDRRRQR